MSLINTRTLGYREMSAGLYKWTERPSEYGALDAAMLDNAAMNAAISPDLAQRALSSIGSDLKAPVFDKQTVTISNVRSLTISANELTSQLVTFTFATLSAGFQQTPTAFNNNEMSLQANFNEQFDAIINKFGETIDTGVLAALSTNKNQVYSSLSPTDLGYTVVGDLVTATNAQREEVIGDIKSLMFGNDYPGNYRLIGNAGLMSTIDKLKEKAIYNEVNKTIQLNMTDTLHFTNRLSNAANYRTTAYAVKTGSLGLLFQHERESLVSRIMKDGTEWGMSTLPRLNIPIDTYFYEGKADQSALWGAATADMTRAYVQAFGWSIGVCYVTVYNQDVTTYPSPILGFQIATA